MDSINESLISNKKNSIHTHALFHTDSGKDSQKILNTKNNHLTCSQNLDESSNECDPLIKNKSLKKSLIVQKSVSSKFSSKKLDRLWGKKPQKAHTSDKNQLTPVIAPLWEGWKVLPPDKHIVQFNKIPFNQRDSGMASAVSDGSHTVDVSHTPSPYQTAISKSNRNRAFHQQSNTINTGLFKSAFTENECRKNRAVQIEWVETPFIPIPFIPIIIPSGAQTVIHQDGQNFSLQSTVDPADFYGVVQLNITAPPALSFQSFNRWSDTVALSNAQISTTIVVPNHSQDQNTAKALQDIITALGSLKGPIVKLAQMVGMIPGLLPDDCAQALLTLCTTAPAMHPSLLRRKMQLEWGKDWQSRFTHFDQKAMAAASLGQIHRATLHDGTLVAVKVQYPAMKQAIQGDLALFKMLLHRWASDQALDMQDFPNEWEQRLYEELDYTSEIRHMACWRSLFKDDPLIHIPLPFPHLTTEQVLTMSWSEAQGIQTAFHQNQDLRNDLGKKIFWAWYYPFYHGGMLHGDPHMGNMAWFCPQPPAVTETGFEKRFYEKNAQIHIFDFGCVRIFSPMFVQGFCHLYQGLLNKKPELTQQAYTELGFKDLTPPMIMALNDWAHFLLAPFLQDQECFLEDVSCPKKALDGMKQLENTLKAHGQTKIPPEFLIFDRVAVILGAVLMRLQVKANWHRLMDPLIQSFCLKKCRIDQKRLLEICKKNDILY